MTGRSIDFYFDFISPYSYLAAIQLPAFSEEYQVAIDWLPVNLPRLISLSGNTPPSTIKKQGDLLASRSEALGRLSRCSVCHDPTGQL